MHTIQIRRTDFAAIYWEKTSDLFLYYIFLYGSDKKIKPRNLESKKQQERLLLYHRILITTSRKRKRLDPLFTF